MCGNRKPQEACYTHAMSYGFLERPVGVLGLCWGLLFGCGPAVDPGDGQADGSQTDGGSETGDASQSETSADTGVPSTSTSGGTDPQTSSGSEDTGPAVPACPEPETLDVSLMVSGLGPDFQGLFEARCTVTALELTDIYDGATLDCLSADGQQTSVAFAYTNSAVLLPAQVQVGAQVGLAYARAAYELRGEWLTLRNTDERLLLGVAAGGYPYPVLSEEGTLDEFYQPLTIETVGGVCPKGPGSCFELGEPAALRFELDGATLEVLPLQVESLDPFSLHAGASWLPDLESPYQCDGQSDEWAAFVAGVP